MRCVCTYDSLTLLASMFIKSHVLQASSRWTPTSIHLTLEPGFVQYHGETFDHPACGVGQALVRAPRDDSETYMAASGTRGMVTVFAIVMPIFRLSHLCPIRAFLTASSRDDCVRD